MKLDEAYWSERYHTNETQWDVGYPTPPLTAYIDQLKVGEINILIPGCGRAYEAEYLWKSGFDNVFVLDYSYEAVADFVNRVPDFPEDQIIIGDFFDLDANSHFDLILEQTFFCALDPKLRKAYVSKMYDLLKPGGKLVGVLFLTESENMEGPPFMANTFQYLGYFQPHFDKVFLRPCKNSIEPRLGRELFVKLTK